MKKFFALLTKEKTAINKCENDDSYVLQALYSVCKNFRTILFPYLIVTLFKQRYSSSVKIYEYLNKFLP